MVRDVGVAEELAQDALVAALEHWPREGVPDNPGAWLMTTAKNRALDHLRRDKMHGAASRSRSATTWKRRRRWSCPTSSMRWMPRAQDDIGDDLLRLIFTACHPVLSTEARVALTLKLLGGLTTARDRARLPGAGADHRPAHRARQAHAGRSARAVRGAARRGAGASGWPRCWRWST